MQITRKKKEVSERVRQAIEARGPRFSSKMKNRMIEESFVLSNEDE